VLGTPLGEEVGQHARDRAQALPSRLNTDFEKAAKGGEESSAVEVQNAVQSRTGSTGQEMTQAPQLPAVVGVGRLLSSADTYCSNTRVGDPGFEPVTSSV
jgi:hypothetical protein